MLVVSARDVEKIKNEASAVGENIGDATDKIELKRKFCSNESFTKVEITIKAKGKLNLPKQRIHAP